MGEYITAKISDVCTIKSGKTVSKNMELDKGNIAYVKVADMNINGNERYITRSSKYLDVDEESGDVFPIGTVIFPKRGGAIGTNKKRLTKCPICADLNIMGVIPSEKVLPEYLFAYFNGVDLGKLSNGSSVPQINNCDIAPLDIPIPEKSIQKKISMVLGKAQQLIDVRKQQITLCDELIKSQFIEMFGDPVRNTMGWELKNVGDFCFVTKLAGFEYTQYIKYQDYGDVIMVRGLNVKNNKLKLDDIYYIDTSTSDLLPRSQLKENDIVMTYVGVNIGDVALVDGNNRYHLAPNVAKISPNSFDEINPIFFVNLLSFNKRNFASNATNTAKQALNMEKIRRLHVMIPPIELQNEFAQFVQQVDKLKFGMEQSLKELQDNFDSLMQRAFKGELF